MPLLNNGGVRFRGMKRFCLCPFLLRNYQNCKLFFLQIDAHVDTLISEQATYTVNRAGLTLVYDRLQQYTPAQGPLSTVPNMDSDSLRAVMVSHVIARSCLLYLNIFVPNMTFLHKIIQRKVGSIFPLISIYPSWMRLHVYESSSLMKWFIVLVLK